jgi:hypothetical protein
LAAPDKKQQERMRGSVGLLAMLSSEPPTYDLGSLFLQVNVGGFIGPYGGSSPTIRAERFFRAFCGLGIALRLFKHSHKLPTGIPTVAKSYFYTHKRDENGNWAPDNRLDVQDTTDRGLGGLQMHDLEGRLETDEQKLSWADGALNNIAAVFSASQKGEPIILASQWLFDSHASRDELLAFIQAMVVLEIILGDKKVSDEIGLGALMRNRCAYLIGASHRERSELLDAFDKIYRVRSQIVHSGKQKLTLDERSLFSRLHWICRRVIDKEVGLLKADMQTGD